MTDDNGSSAARWDALEGVVLRRPYMPGRLCLLCRKWTRRGGLATCSPRCNRLWRAFLDNQIAPARPRKLKADSRRRGVE